MGQANITEQIEKSEKLIFMTLSEEKPIWS